MRPRLAILMLAAVTLAAQACAPAAAPTAAPLKPVSLKVVILPFIAFAPFWIAQDEGYFKEQALDIELVDMTQQQDTIPALVSGQVDVTSGQPSAGMFNSIARGAKMKFVADKGYIDTKGCNNLALLARKGLVADPKNPKPDELKGKKLNFVKGSWMEYYLEKLLSSSGIKLTDFDTSIYLAAAQQPEAMAKGTIDLTAQNEPWVTRLADAGNVAIFKPVIEVMPDSVSAVTIFGAKLIGENSEVGKRFTLAYLKAVRKYAEGKTDSNVKTLSKYTQLDEALLKRMCWPALKTDGTLNMASILDFQAWTVAKKQVEAPLTAEQIYDAQYVQYANQMLGKQ